jgi:hypothetical protein
MVDKKNGKAKKLKEQIDKMNQSLARPEVSEFIGQRLRKFYDGVSQQPEEATPPEKDN